MSLIDEAIAQVGELIHFGFKGKELSDETSAFLSQARPGGVIFFAHNFESVEQLCRVNNHIQSHSSDLPFWISVDHEGGRVQRFRKTFIELPPAFKIGQQGSQKWAYDLAEAAGKELRSVGFNLNFSPDGDILTNPKNPVIGDRAYGETEEMVSRFVSSVARGYLQAGIQPCIKHFPGHGDTEVDSHFALPTVRTPLEVLREREFKPFLKAFKSKCNWVMTAHIVNPSIDPDLPATLSAKTLRFLREELRFQGIIASDDMEMQAITDHFGADEAPCRAIEAGCNVLLYRSEATARHGYESLIRGLETGKLSAERVLTSVQLSQSFKERDLLPYSPVDIGTALATVGCDAHKALLSQPS